MAFDQTGCRSLQKRLSDGDTRFNEVLIDSLLHVVPDLMLDQFGNYLM